MDVIQGVTLLTALNWEVWKVDTRVSLMHYGAWEFIEQEEERSPEEEAKLPWRDQSDLKLRKDRAFTLIYQSVSNERKHGKFCESILSQLREQELSNYSTNSSVPDTFLAKILVYLSAVPSVLPSV
ncbi:hypothetical protein TNCV_1471271 [Trichonephila clavipes]|nr:hypothetical protein TNCV_1471271 [Trichonephila clavipes]